VLPERGGGGGGEEEGEGTLAILFISSFFQIQVLGICKLG